MFTELREELIKTIPFSDLLLRLPKQVIIEYNNILYTVKDAGKFNKKVTMGGDDVYVMRYSNVEEIRKVLYDKLIGCKLILTKDFMESSSKYKELELKNMERISLVK